LDLLRPLRLSDAVGIAAGFILAMALWDVSRSLVGGTLGALLDKINLRNDSGSFRLELGSILTTALSAALALAVLVLLLRSGDRRDSG
jgi:hypothetical protein